MQLFLEPITNEEPSPALTLRARRFNAGLVGGGPERTDGAAGSAIKGVSVLPTARPTVLERASLPETTSTDPDTTSAALGSMTADIDRPPVLLTLFTVSRDQRLSRWDIVEDSSSLASVSPNAERARPGRIPADDGSSVRKTGQSQTTPAADGAGSVGVCSAQVEQRARRSNTPCGINIDGYAHDASADITPGGRYVEGHGHGDARVDGCATSSALEGTGVLRQGRQVEKWRRRRRWRLVWRAGCVTDVCDVSGLDAVALPLDSQVSENNNSDSSRSNHCHHIRNPYRADRSQQFGRSTSFKDLRTATVCEQGADGGDEEIRATGSSGRAALVSPAAIVAVSGQGLQLVHFGAC